MLIVNDVVQLANGWVGVIGEDASERPSGNFLVYFPNSHLDVPEAEIGATLVARTFSVAETVEVWPYQGVIQTLNSSEASVELDRTIILPGGGRQSWMPIVTVPVWRLIRDNDPQLERDF